MARIRRARRESVALLAAVVLSSFTIGALVFGNAASAAPKTPPGQPSPTGSVAPTPINTPAPMPADKAAAMGNTVDDLSDNADHVVLEEQMKVSSPEELILNLSAECAIITQVVTAGDNTPGATSESHTSGKVEVYVTIDGTRVPVAQSNPNNPASGDDGTVVFCNHARGRQVEDMESPQDGVDKIADYLSARQANAFQWMALNVGTAYDNPANGNNLLDIQVHAIYTDDEGTGPDCQTLAKQDPTTTYGETCSKAFLGRRTLIVEPTKASVIETTATGQGGS